MKPVCLRIGTLALRCASWLAPAGERKDWFREWKAELWHIGQLHPAQIVAPFVAGAFQDAFFLRTDLRRASERKPADFRSSPRLCLLALLLASALTLALALLPPGPRALLLPSPYADARRLVIVSRDGSEQNLVPSVSLGEFRHWQHTAQNVFSDLAFYQIVRRQLHTGHGSAVEVLMARASADLLPILHSSRFPAGFTMVSGGPQLILSDALWRASFHSDPKIAGRTVFVMGEKATIAGVARPDAWRLPGKADAWLIEDPSRIEALAAESMGFVVARMQPALTRNPSEDRWHIAVSQNDGWVFGFTCVSVRHYARQPLYFFAFAVLLALLALPATTSLPLGEYPYNPQQQPLLLRLRRWLFLCAKLTLILPAVGFGALDAAQLFPDTQSAQILLTFAAALAAFRWVLRDQRQRCPVCLELLRNPVRVGQPSRNFLAWNGTELICAVGHGFLHVPELPTSWFGTQRWLYLDASWRSIFRPQEMARST